MLSVFIYIPDTMADWEIGYVATELHSKRFFKKDAPQVTVKTASWSKEPVKTMGGLTILPDCTVDEVTADKNTVLILPGSNTWGETRHLAVVKKADEVLETGGTVGAICGATVALAFAGILDNRPHTSNGAGFLEMFCPIYKGKDFYVDVPSVADKNLITASGTGGLLFAKQILERLGVFSEKSLDAWYAYFSTGDAAQFFALMQSLQ